ncbi:uncharacterized protein [Antedon mediterranea]|uniref:uncharacterized protein n=1 Tax=Antedon mediterranea TaxID=105859 RepID=UPI003AF58A18
MPFSTEEVVEALNDARFLGLDATDRATIGDMATEFFSNRLEEDSEEDSSESEEELDFGIPEAEEKSEIEDVDMSEGEEDGPMPAVVVDPGLDIVNGLLNQGGMEDWAGPANEDERTAIQTFRRCRCPRNRDQANPNPCLNQFEEEYVLNLRAQMQELSAVERKMFLMGKISATIKNTAQTQKSRRSVQSERQKSRITYLVEGQKVCRQSFEYMHSISNCQLQGIISHYKTTGVTPPLKKSGGRRFSKTALSETDVRHVVGYISNYAVFNGMVIPGRVRGVKCQDPRVRLLPSCETKSGVWRKHKAQLMDVNERRITAGHSEIRIIKRTTFSKVWRQFCPFILTTKPRSDLCWVCQKNNSAVYRSANQTEAQKNAQLEAQLEHLRVVHLERDLLRSMIADAKAVITDERLGPNAPCSRKITMHYSFDFAQQVSYPSDPLQPGPTYFICTRKLGIFGIACEAVPQQQNFLIDEGVAISKGSNVVISYVHDFFLDGGLGEEHCLLHCDNCSGQNKNKYVLWYLAWRTMHGLHKSIGLNFLIAGHTKFAPDQGFGLLKQRFKKCMVSCLDDMKKVVETSSHSGYNKAKIVGAEDGTMHVPAYNWQTFLEPFFKPLPQIKSLHHMRFCCDNPGMVFYKKYSDSPEQSFQLLRNLDVLPPVELPTPIVPPGLTYERQLYLHNSVREFCTEETQDIVCPRPVREDEEPPRRRQRVR